MDSQFGKSNGVSPQNPVRGVSLTDDTLSFLLALPPPEATMRAMTSEQKTRLAQGLIFGYFFQLLGDFMKEVSSKPAAPYYGGAICEIMGYVIFAWGCTHLVAAKRLPKWTNLLGFLSVIGLAILIVWPSRASAPADAPSPSTPST